MAAVRETVETVRSIDVDAYKYGFITDIESDKAPKGLSEDIVRLISKKKKEPDWLTEWRLDAYRRWLTMREPTWARVDHPPIDYQELYYYSAPKSTEGPRSLAEVDPSCCAPTRSSASRCASRKCLPACRMRASRLTRFSIRSRSSRLSRKSSPKPASSSARFRKPCTIIPNLCASISAPWCR